MERFKLDAAPRALLRKQKVKRLRREGWLPAVMYGRGIEPTPLQVRKDAFVQVMKDAAHGHNPLLDLSIEGSPAPATVMVKKIQRDAVTLALLNIDFHRISITDRVTNRVPVELVGEPRGLAQGGVLLQPVAELEIVGVAGDLPGAIQADVSGLGVDESLHVRDLKLPEGIEVHAPADEVVAIVHPPRVAEEVPVEPEKITEPELAVKPKEE